MRKTFILAVSLIIISATAFAHAGHKHSFLGTVKAVSANELTIATVDAKDATFVLTNKTAYLRDGAPARKQDLVPGLRVAVLVDEDGRTATTIKLAK